MSTVDMDRDVVDPPELGEVVVLGMATTTSRFSPLSPRRSPVSSIPHIVVESPTSYEAPVGLKDVCLAADLAGPLLPHESQVSQLSQVSSLSITDYAADLTLLSEPFIPFPEVMLLKPAPAPVRPNSYPGCQPSPVLALSVNPSPAVLSHEGPFDTFTDLPGGGCCSDGYVVRDAAASPEISSASARRSRHGCWVVPQPSSFRGAVSG